VVAEASDFNEDQVNLAVTIFHSTGKSAGRSAWRDKISPGV